MRLILLGLGVFAAGALAHGVSAAETVTPPNCHWAPTASASEVVALWCRGEDGRARPTGQTLAQRAGGTWDGCPRGLMYDGVRCVSEARAVANARSAPLLSYSAAAEPTTPSYQPDIWIYRDRKGRNRGGDACTTQGSVRICKPIPHY